MALIFRQTEAGGKFPAGFLCVTHGFFAGKLIVTVVPLPFELWKPMVPLYFAIIL